MIQVTEKDIWFFKENLKRIIALSRKNNVDCVESIVLILTEILPQQRNNWLDASIHNTHIDQSSYLSDDMYRWNDETEKQFIGLLYKLLPYEVYLKTDHWRNRRESCVNRFKNKCAVCNSDKDLEVHHRTYDNLGAEEPDDTTCLCSKCHGLFHEKSILKRG